MLLHRVILTQIDRMVPRLDFIGELSVLGRILLRLLSDDIIVVLFFQIYALAVFLPKKSLLILCQQMLLIMTRKMLSIHIRILTELS